MHPPASISARMAIAASLGVAVIGICLASGAPRSDAEESIRLAMNLPASLGVWRGSPGAVSRAERELLPEDTEFAKMDYQRGHGMWQERVYCSIVLAGKDRTSIHRPEVCLTGQGWNITASHEKVIVLRNEANLSVRQLSLSREGESGELQRAIYYYWFVGGEVTTADHLQRILLTAKENVIHNRNPRWAYVSVLAGVSADQRRYGGQSDSEAEAMLEDFISRITPQFQSSFTKVDWF